MKPTILPVTTIIRKAFKLVLLKEYFLKYFILGLVLSTFGFLFNLITKIPSTISSQFLTLVVFLLFAFLYLFFFALSETFIYYFGNEVVFEKSILVKEILIKSVKSAFRFLITTLTLGLIVLGGTLLLVIPAIIWGVRFSFAPIISVLEEKNPKDALNTSKQLTNGYFWSILIRLGMFAFISSIPGFVLSKLNPNLNFLSSLFVPIFVLFYLILYYQLKAIKQNTPTLEH